MIRPMFGHYCGMELIKNNLLLVSSDIPKRTHKRKCIQKKWVKKYGFRMLPDPNYYIVGSKVVAHEAILKKLIKAVQ